MSAAGKNQPDCRTGGATFPYPLLSQGRLRLTAVAIIAIVSAVFSRISSSKCLILCTTWERYYCTALAPVSICYSQSSIHFIFVILPLTLCLLDSHRVARRS
jgi:hypothetical protein